MMKKIELVFIPSSGTTHVVSTVQLAKLLLDRNGRFSVTVLVTKPLLGPSMDNQSYFSNYPQIRFIELAPVDPPSTDLLLQSLERCFGLYMEFYKDSAKEAIVNHVLPNCDRLAGLVIDMFCTSMVDVGNDLGVPSYLYFTSGAASLGFLFHLPIRHEQGLEEFERSDPDSVIPSYINPVPTEVLPAVVFNKNGGYSSFLTHARRFKETKGIVINTCLELEHHAVQSGSVYNDLPHVYTVGPLINHNSHHPWKSNHEEDGKILRWLDDQPQSSVVFLCFGSLGSFSKPQLREIAIALEKSCHRFLWSIRTNDKDDLGTTPVENKHYSQILPDGFLERTHDRGLLCGWTPQVEVLGHKSVGCFLSHCGWNSILESLWFGVPIVTWPLYAEQHLNAFEMVKDLNVSVELELDYRLGSDTVVKADDIANVLQYVMKADCEERKKVEVLSKRMREGVVEGGSSFESIGKWIEDIEEGSQLGRLNSQ